MRRIGSTAFGGSALLHMIALGTVAYWAGSPAPVESRTEIDIALVPTSPAVTHSARRSPSVSIPPREIPRQGGDQQMLPDRLAPGRGGDGAGAPALNLASSSERVTRTRDIKNRLDRSQVQRIDTGRERASRENRRATPNPMQLSLLASGEWEREQRRRPSRADGASGLPSGGVPTRAGTRGLTGPNIASAELEPVGQRQEVRPRGVQQQRRYDGQRRSARVMLARPQVKRARASIPSETRGRPRDTVDSRQEVANAIESLVLSSSSGGTGRDGRGAIATPGAGNGKQSDNAAHASPSGTGAGPIRDDGADDRRVAYFRNLVHNFEPLWRDAFPTDAIAEGVSGLCIISVRILSDGSLAEARVRRASGVPLFDSRLLAALRGASPFPPLPAVLGVSSLRAQIGFDALNAAVPLRRR
ncbi:MAG: TonB C-terminal domain-containing protein [Polyangiaceae bacterium]|nr:TonB C-terminal domain-containing protein [Polyangiaceae bacterium]